MSIFNRKRKVMDESTQEDNKQERLKGGDYGIHFPWVSIIFLIVGIASEITDALLLKDVLSPILSSLGPTFVSIISFITGAVCFFSMAAIGYQSANEKVPYRTKRIEIGIWLAVGFYLVWLRINGALFEWEGFKAFFSNKDVVMGGLALLLYVGTGFMTYFSTKQLTNRKLYEYLMAQREYDRIIDEIADLREEISDGIAALNIYPKYVKRLNKSSEEVLRNIETYNKAVKALCEAKISLIIEPDQMDDVFARANSKNKNND